MSSSDEILLTGGNVSDLAVRIGHTVRKPSGPWSPSVDLFLRHLESTGYNHAPKSLGFDEKGRHVLEYVEGHLAMPFDQSQSKVDLVSLGRVIREFHDASESFVIPSDAIWNVAIKPDVEHLVIHHDIAPWNLILNRDRMMLIDWDGVGPGSRLWDLAYACNGFVPFAPLTDIPTASERLNVIVKSYGLSEEDRELLASLLVPRIMSMYTLLLDGHVNDKQPWSRLWNEGHGETWLGFADYATENFDRLTSGLVGNSPTQPGA